MNAHVQRAELDRLTSRSFDDVISGVPVLPGSHVPAREALGSKRVPMRHRRERPPILAEVAVVLAVIDAGLLIIALWMIWRWAS